MTHVIPIPEENYAGAEAVLCKILDDYAPAKVESFYTGELQELAELLAKKYKSERAAKVKSSYKKLYELVVKVYNGRVGKKIYNETIH